MKEVIKLTENELKGVVKKCILEAISEARNKQTFRTWNGFVVLQHDSSEKISDGVIDSTNAQQRGYSNNSDFGNYFWASDFPGRDPSNTSQFHYYSLVRPDAIYDMERNEKGYPSLRDAVENEEYASTRWKDGAIAVVSIRPTPIQFIQADGGFGDIGGIFDAKWHLLRPTGRYSDRKKNMELAKLIKPYRNVKVPDFLDGYTYDDLVSEKNS